MNLYKIHIRGAVLDWAGTQVDAKKAQEAQELLFPGESVTWEPHEVPVDKPSLIAWLKANAVAQPQPELRQGLVPTGERPVKPVAEQLHQSSPQTFNSNDY